MAEAETLTFRFVEEGIDALRKGLGQVQSDLDDTGKQAKESASDYIAGMIKMRDFTEEVNGELQTTLDRLDKLDGSEASINLQAADVNVSGGGGGGGGGGETSGTSTAFQGVQAAALTGNLIATVADLKEKADAVTDIKDGVQVLSGAVEGLEDGFRRAMDVDLADDVAQHLKEAEVIADSFHESLQDVSIEMDDVADKASHVGRGSDLNDFTPNPGQIGGQDLFRTPDDAPEATRDLSDLVNDEDKIRQWAEDVGESMGDVTDDMRTAGDAIQELGDRINGALDYFDQFSESLQPVKDQIDSFTDELVDSEGSFIGFGSAARKAARKLGPLGTAASIAAGAIATLTAGLAAGTAAAVRFSQEMGRMAQQLKVAEAQSGATAESIQEIFLGVKTFDSQADIDSVRDGFKEFSLRLQEAKEGTGEAREAFDRLGISLQSIEDMNPGKVLTNEVLPAMREMEDASLTLTAEQLMGGEGGERFIRFLKLSREEAARLNAQLQSLQIPSAAISELDDMRSKWTLLGKRVDKLKTLFSAAFAPVIEGVVLPALNLLTKGAIAATKHLGRMMSKLQVFLGMVQRSRTSVGNLLRLFEFFNTVQLPDTGPGGAGAAATGGQGQDLQEGIAEANKKFRKARQDLRDDLARGLISEEEFQKQLVSIRRSYFETIRDLDQNTDLDLSGFVDTLAKKLKAAQHRLEDLKNEAESSTSLQQASDVSPVQPENTTIEQQMPDLDAELNLFAELKAELRKINRLPFLPNAEKSKQKVQAVTQRIKELQEAGFLMSEQALTGFLEDLGLSEKMINRIINKMRQAGDEAKTAGAKIKGGIQDALERAANQTFQALGQSVAQGIFGGGGGRGIAQQKLSLFNAKDQVRRLRESLRQGEISYKKFQLKIQAAQGRIQKRQEALNDSMEGGFTSALESMGDAMKRIGKQLLAEITAIIAKMAILKAIATAFNVGTGGFGGAVISGLGGGMFLNSSPSAPTSGVSQPKLNVGITGEMKMRGDDMAAQLSASQRRQRRKGRING